MASYATLTINAADIIGADFDRSRCSAYIETNTPHGLVVVDGANIRLGGRRENPDATGTITFPNLVTTNSADNPTSFAYKVTIVYVPKGSRKQGHDSITTSEFELTASADLASISAAWDDIAIPPSWKSDFMDQAQALLDQQEAISGLTGEDAAIANRLNTSTSASYAAFRAQESFGRRGPAVRYHPISGVIRKTAGAWAPIADAAHQPTNIASVEVIDDIRIRVHYGVTGSVVGTLGAWLDESYAYYGYHIGASVNPDYADFYVYQTRNVGGYVAYDGTNWTSSPANEFRNITFSAGIVSMEHDNVGGAILNVTDRTNSSGTLRRYFGGTVTSTTTTVEIRTVSTNEPLAAPDASVKMYVDRGVTRRAVKISEMPEGSTNLWIFGLMEV